ncbi:glycosyltransferase family 4 protein [Ideonella sp.]|uniref:glycosyltransferase family 4 protein n=1 Tax=Ideonella sp. TaxID=1929293 RepID=UPI0035AE1ED6
MSDRHVPAAADGASSAPMRRADGAAPRIVLDGYNLAMDKGTGVATYARNLSHALKALGAEVEVLYGAPIQAGYDDLLKEVMFFDAAPAAQPGRLQQLLRPLRSLRPGNRHQAFRVPVTGAVVTRGLVGRLPSFDALWNVHRLFERAHVKFELLRSIQKVRLPGPADLMHWTYPVPVRIRGMPNVYTLHDLVPLRLPYTTLDRKASYLALVKWVARTADHIVTVSEASRRDIIELLGVPEDRVTNTYQAVHIPREFAEMSDAEVADTVGTNFGLEPRGYFLFFGSIEPKKNVGRIVEAFLSAGTGSQLVIVGARAWRSAEETRLLDALPSGDNRVRRFDYVPFPMLVQLIRGARAVVFPSLYEGFGLPVLEAMSLGTPVIGSTTSSVPEVAGDAALLVDPYRAHDIAQAIRQIDADDDLCFELSRRGRLQAERFSPAAYGQRLREVYRGLGITAS